MATQAATRHTLIRRACNSGDEDAWAEFDRVYRRFISFVVRQIGVANDDVDDLTQEILVTLIRDLPGYDRDRAAFRTWLSAVIRHAALAHLQRQRRTQQQIVSQWPEVPEPAGDESELDRRIEAEWTTYLANMAMSRIREQFQGRAIEVFEMSLDGRAIDEITAATGLTAASVYTLRKRVKRRLLLEIRTLIQELEP